MIFISLLGPHPHSPEGVGRSFRAGEIYKVLEGTIFLHFSAASFSSVLPSEDSWLLLSVQVDEAGREAGEGHKTGEGKHRLPISVNSAPLFTASSRETLSSFPFIHVPKNSQASGHQPPDCPSIILLLQSSRPASPSRSVWSKHTAVRPILSIQGPCYLQCMVHGRGYGVRLPRVQIPALSLTRCVHFRQKTS